MSNVTELPSAGTVPVTLTDDAEAAAACACFSSSLAVGIDPSDGLDAELVGVALADGSDELPPQPLSPTTTAAATVTAAMAVDEERMLDLTGPPRVTAPQMRDTCPNTVPAGPLLPTDLVLVPGGVQRQNER